MLQQLSCYVGNTIHFKERMNLFKKIKVIHNLITLIQGLITVKLAICLHTLHA